jgi:hypothetical protein
MLTELVMASWETVTRRALLIAENKCSPTEYARMFDEKAEAAAIAGFITMSSGGRITPASMLAPWHRHAVANARRLRKK